MGFWFVFSKQSFSVEQLWLPWNSLCRPGWPRTHGAPLPLPPERCYATTARSLSWFWSRHSITATDSANIEVDTFLTQIGLKRGRNKQTNKETKLLTVPLTNITGEFPICLCICVQMNEDWVHRRHCTHVEVRGQPQVSLLSTWFEASLFVGSCLTSFQIEKLLSLPYAMGILGLQKACCDYRCMLGLQMNATTSGFTWVLEI